MTARYLSKKALKWTDAEKTQTFENFIRRRSRQDLTETCLGHLGPSLNHPWSWFSLTILFDPRWLQENRVVECFKYNFFGCIHLGGLKLYSLFVYFGIVKTEVALELWGTKLDLINFYKFLYIFMTLSPFSTIQCRSP